MILGSTREFHRILIRHDEKDNKEKEKLTFSNIGIE
jgi:hypothetical protein